MKSQPVASRKGAPRTVTSLQPLDVSFLPPCSTPQGGRLALSSCPGKHTVARDGTCYARDVGRDLEFLRDNHGVEAVVCLLPEAELRYLRVRDYAQHVSSTGLEYVQFPIIEMAAPEDLQAAASCVDSVVALLRQGKTLLMHCKGGIGRAGLMACCVLLRLGGCSTATEAIATVRQHRRGAVESRRQEEFIARYCHWLTVQGQQPLQGGEQQEAQQQPGQQQEQEQGQQQGGQFPQQQFHTQHPQYQQQQRWPEPRQSGGRTRRGRGDDG